MDSLVNEYFERWWRLVEEDVFLKDTKAVAKACFEAGIMMGLRHRKQFIQKEQDAIKTLA